MRIAQRLRGYSVEVFATALEWIVSTQFTSRRKPTALLPLTGRVERVSSQDRILGALQNDFQPAEIDRLEDPTIESRWIVSVCFFFWISASEGHIPRLDVIKSIILSYRRGHGNDCHSIRKAWWSSRPELATLRLFLREAYHSSCYGAVYKRHLSKL